MGLLDDRRAGYTGADNLRTIAIGTGQRTAVDGLCEKKCAGQNTAQDARWR
jgi:hypothetical protein